MTDEFVSLDINAYNRVHNKLRRMASEGEAYLDDTMGEFATKRRRYLKHKAYPAKRPGQRYVRAGRLANSWRVERQGASRYTIRNTANYSGFVVGRERQAWMHKGRWWIFEDEMEQAMPELTKALSQRITREWGRG